MKYQFACCLGIFPSLCIGTNKLCVCGEGSVWGGRERGGEGETWSS